MARGAAKQGRSRPKPDARPKRRRSSGGTGVEQTLFFPRLRRQAKWVFVLLALVFAGGFVFFGVGSGNSGIGDLLRGNLGIFGGGSSSSAPSVSKAEKRIEKNPKDAQAYLDLATAHETRGENDAAVSALQGYLSLKPRDTDALSRLASLYTGQAQLLRTEAQAVQAASQDVLASSTFAPPIQLAPGQTVGQDPITQALSSQATTRFSDVLSRMQKAFGQAQQTYQRLTSLQPQDAQLQLALADASLSAGDTKTAIGAYRKFLKLAPDDTNAPLVRQRIKQLQAQSKPATPRSGSSG